MRPKKQLGYMSPSMCYAKWAQTSLHLTNGKTHSCYHTPLHPIAPGSIVVDPWRTYENSNVTVIHYGNTRSNE